MVNRMKQKIKNGEPLFGAVIAIWYPELAPVINNIGLDWILFDMQHSPVTLGMVRSYVRGIDQTKTAAMVRVTASHPALISHALDMGIYGVVIPDVDTKEETEMILSAAKYPPVGGRSINRLMTPAEAEETNENIVVIPMIETQEGLDNIDEILSVDGVDGILIGPNDLSCSLGIFTQYTHPKFVDAIERIASACNRRAIPCGFLAPIEPPEKPIELGCRLFTVGSDIGFLQSGAIGALQRAKDALTG